MNMMIVLSAATVLSVAAAGAAEAEKPQEWTWIEGTKLPLEGKAFAAGETCGPYDRLPGDCTNVSDGVAEHLVCTAGLSFRFRTSSAKLRIRWTPRYADLAMPHMPATGKSGVDVYQRTGKDGWWYVKPPWWAMPNPVRADHVWTITPNAPTIVNLPLYNGLKDISIGLEKGCTVEPLPPHASGVRKPVVFYGTSTTQGGCVSRPGLLWTSILARRLDIPVVNLGFSGSGKMEDRLLECVSSIDASAYVLDTIGNMPPELIDARFENFVRELNRRRPETPILVTANGWVFDDDYRARAAHVKAVYAKLKAEDPVKWKKFRFAGDYGSGIAPDAEGTVDGVHLNDLGSFRVAGYLAPIIAEMLGL